jgi:hypothetical protein
MEGVGERLSRIPGVKSLFHGVFREWPTTKAVI